MAISPRRRARHSVLQALYAHTISGDSRNHVAKTILLPRLPDHKGAVELGIQLFEKVISEQQNLDEIISKNAKNWDLDRILKIDLIILRMAICEFLCFDQIPPKATMNEAIEMSKIFSTEESKDFVNGVLDSIAFTLRYDGKMIKRDGGLQGWEEFVNQQDRKRSH